MAKRHLGSIAAYSGARNGFGAARTSFPVEDNIYKFKRFLGSLARGGWFPRQFRGFVSPNNYQQKRHIGSVARLGWLPYKNNREDYHM
ncbi:unnamed protein product [Allacma fusca]|uniref:Uncharacterized protein n=1 Tax=Allacma fusca TaxID=39272 RepID=A0A8J2JX33_9HEXA|nr:unnamed protein product [Allacma fusca]